MLRAAAGGDVAAAPAPPTVSPSWPTAAALLPLMTTGLQKEGAAGRGRRLCCLRSLRSARV